MTSEFTITTEYDPHRGRPHKRFIISEFPENVDVRKIAKLVARQLAPLACYSDTTRRKIAIADENTTLQQMQTIVAAILHQCRACN